MGAQTAKQAVEAAKGQGVDLSSKYAIVTGSSSGIGLETARALAEGGVNVTMACRNQDRAKRCIEEMQGEGDFKGRLFVLQADLESFQSVQRFAKLYLASGKPLNILICNAGLFPYLHEITADGYEKTFQVCHLSHYLMFKLLQDKLVECAPSRVVMVASITHKLAPEPWDWPNRASVHKGFGVESGIARMDAYGQAKLANIHMAQHIAALLGRKGVRAFSCHPGGVDSGIYPWFSKPLMKLIMLTVEQGAATTCKLALSKDMEAFEDPAFAPYMENGAMGYLGTKVYQLSPFASNVENRERLIRESDAILSEFLAR